MIHEGTNGIQSLDLLGRKAKHGIPILADRIKQDISRCLEFNDKSLNERGRILEDAVSRLVLTTDLLVGKGAPPAKLALANSHEYLNMTGHTVIAWMWLRQELAALNLVIAPSEFSGTFLQGKRLASQFFFQHELPKTIAQATLLQSLDDTVLKMENSFF